MTGLRCESTKTCFRENGSGFYIVDDAETQKGDADHGYMNFGGGRFNDEGFAPPAAHPWSLATNLDWLRSFVAEVEDTPEEETR